MTKDEYGQKARLTGPKTDVQSQTATVDWQEELRVTGFGGATRALIGSPVARAYDNFKVTGESKRLWSANAKVKPVEFTNVTPAGKPVVSLGAPERVSTEATKLSAKRQKINISCKTSKQLSLRPIRRTVGFFSKLRGRVSASYKKCEKNSS